MKNISQDLNRISRKTSTKKGWKWGDEDTRAIQKIKQKVKGLPQLSLPTDQDEFVLEIDASNDYWEATMKIGGRRPEPVCTYWSAILKGYELKYHIHEKEVLALKFGIKSFYTFLAPKKFLVRTDSQYVRKLYNFLGNVVL